jgi:hypothetical protein
MKIASRSIKYRVKMLGTENEKALGSTTGLAVAYRLIDRWEEAGQLEVQVMTCKTTLKPDHPDTLTSIDNLAFTFESTS